jgi:hypothetical protein
MPTSGDDFQSVLTAAVEDMIQNGFDSVERVARWTRLIREAAERSLIPPESLDQRLRDALAETYRKMVEKDGIVKFHPGIERFTLERIKPALRAELDRRILASADLIKLNREQAVDKTIQRFQGWATSIPKGGTENADKRDTKDRVRKALAQLPFEERRVLIDQGHKLTSTISEILASDGGAIAGRWVSHFTQPGYNYREDHKDRDFRETGNVYLVRDSWAHRAGYVKPQPGVGFTDDITKPAEEPFCFPGDSRVPFADGVEKAYRRFYRGELTTIVTASGKTLRATPNHPVLTPNGWTAIGFLNEGDDVIDVAHQVLDSSKEDEDHRVPLIAKIFSALAECGTSQVVRGQLEQFHGDGTDAEVDVVDATGILRFRIEPMKAESRCQVVFSVAPAGAAAARTFNFFGDGSRAARTGLVSGGHEPAPSVFSLTGHPDPVGGGGVAEVDVQILRKGAARNLQPSGQAKEAFPFEVRTTRIVSIERRQWTGHVYNLQTEKGWYVADGIIVQNCRCYYRWLYALRELPPEMLTAKGKAALDQARIAARTDSDLDEIESALRADAEDAA